ARTATRGDRVCRCRPRAHAAHAGADRSGGGFSDCRIAVDPLKPGDIVYNRQIRPKHSNVMATALSLSLPPLDERPSHPPETRIGRVGPWLDDVLKRSPVEAAGVIGDALAATNRVSLSESRRLELSEKYYAAAQSLWPNLERLFSRAPQPLSG